MPSIASTNIAANKTSTSKSPSMSKPKPGTDGSSTFQLASRGERLIAVIIDSVIIAIVAVPVMLVLGFTGVTNGTGVISQMIGMLAGVGVFLALNYQLLKNSGQTIGKRLMNVRIVGRDNQLMNVNDLIFKRYAPIWGAGLIPYVGGLLCLLNALLIFRDSKACGHDELAQTKVVGA